MQYTQLVAGKETANSIAAWLNWSKAPSTDILAEAEAYLCGRLRIREMQLLATGTIALNATSLSFPSDFLAPISFRLSGAASGNIDILDPAHFEQRFMDDGTGAYVSGIPMECMIVGSPPVAHFPVKSSAAYSYRLVYYAKPAALSGDNETNFLTSRYPKLLRTACLMEGWAFYGDEKKSQVEAQKLERLIYEANAEADMERQAFRIETYQGH